ncbi:MAG: GH3 family domain-containing protein [Candidatus Helarchaeota archaeon]
MALLRILGMAFSKSLNRILNSSKKPFDLQRKLLTDIIKVNKNTLFGKKHNFSDIRTIRDFQSQCPIRIYSDFEPYIDRMINGEKFILVGSRQVYWGKTAGSSGKSKMIPITRKSIINATKCSLRIILSYISENPKENSKILDGIMYFFSSNPNLGELNGIPVGFGTGAFYQSSLGGISKYLNFNMHSPSKYYCIKDFKTRIKAIIKDCYKLNITSFFGVTSILINFMEMLVENASKFGIRANNLIDIFPNYTFSIMGGEPFKFYENRLKNVVGRKINCREIYGATEETIAVQMNEFSGLTPMLDTNFFEFIPVNSPDERLLINEVEKRKEYYIILTNYNGLYAYNIEDVIEFISMDPPLLVFKRRKDTVNLASEKLTLEQIYLSIKKADNKYNSKIKDYVICGTYDPRPRYILLIEFLKDFYPKNYIGYLKEFNANLMNINSIYEDLINIQKAISPPIMYILKENSFKDYQLEQLNAGKPAGQTKFPRLSINQEIIEYFSDKIIKKIEIN